ncbi:uncharacterized protein LOC130143467 [Falco biarmicus]|uniref:uncharacterized protein LOC130143467 n=1 Tax=Falco biarmicus TaxID=345155 RepID=UPI0024BC04AF|nr:uncharacterized protein LOC130143467 [Falco biarmicus]
MFLLLAEDVKNEPLNHRWLSRATSFPWHVVQSCVQETILLHSFQLRNRQRLAFTFKDIGVLSFTDNVLCMRFYCDCVTGLESKASWIALLSTASCSGFEGDAVTLGSLLKGAEAHPGKLLQRRRKLSLAALPSQGPGTRQKDLGKKTSESALPPCPGSSPRMKEAGRQEPASPAKPTSTLPSSDDCQKALQEVWQLPAEWEQVRPKWQEQLEQAKAEWAAWGAWSAGKDRQQPQDVSGVLSEQDDWEDKYDKELCQEEETLIYSIWANPSFLDFYQDTHAGLQDGPCWLSSVGRGTSGDKARNLQGVSPVPEEHMDDKPAAAALTGAPVEEWYCASLATVGKEARKTPASPLLSEQPTAVAESQAAAPHSPIAYNMALQDTDDCKMREVLHEALPAIQELSQQLAEHGDPAQSVGVVMAAAPPAAPQDSEPPLSGEPQREPSTATESPAAHKDEVAPSLPQPPAPDDAALPHLEPAGDNKRDYMDSTLSAESWHQGAPRFLSEEENWEHDDIELCRAGIIIYSIWVNPSFLEFCQEPRGGFQERQPDNTWPCSEPRDEPEDEPGMAALPHAPARRRRPSLFRRALRALCKAFCCTCIRPQREQQRRAGRRVPRDGSWP